MSGRVPGRQSGRHSPGPGGLAGHPPARHFPATCQRMAISGFLLPFSGLLSLFYLPNRFPSSPPAIRHLGRPVLMPRWRLAFLAHRPAMPGACRAIAAGNRKNRDSCQCGDLRLDDWIKWLCATPHRRPGRSGRPPGRNLGRHSVQRPEIGTSDRVPISPPFLFLVTAGFRAFFAYHACIDFGHHNGCDSGFS
jgi:hypothetical protein